MKSTLDPSITVRLDKSDWQDSYVHILHKVTRVRRVSLQTAELMKHLVVVNRNS